MSPDSGAGSRMNEQEQESTVASRQGSGALGAAIDKKKKKADEVQGTGSQLQKLDRAPPDDNRGARTARRAGTAKEGDQGRLAQGKGGDEEQASRWAVPSSKPTQQPAPLAVSERPSALRAAGAGSDAAAGALSMSMGWERQSAVDLADGSAFDSSARSCLRA